MTGGTKKEYRSLIFVIRQSANGKARNTLEIDYDSIRKGLTKDFVLEKGDVVFVARGCSDGKLLHPTTKKIGINDNLVSLINQ